MDGKTTTTTTDTKINKRESIADDIHIVKKEGISKGTKRAIIVLLTVSLIGLILGLIFGLQKGKFSKSDAIVFILDDAQNGKYSNETALNTVTKPEITKSFNVFDKNNDGKLNKNEFNELYFTFVNQTSFFNTVDANNDDVWSLKELVAFYVYSFTNLTDDLTDFDYSVELNQISNDFKNFDINKNGYVTIDEFSLIRSQEEFNNFDVSPKDNSITINEIKNGFSTYMRKIPSGTNEITVTNNMINNINITSCNTIFENNNNNRRRLRRAPRRCCRTKCCEGNYGRCTCCSGYGRGRTCRSCCCGNCGRQCGPRSNNCRPT